MALTQEQSKIFGDYEQMFMTEGWRRLIGDTKENKQALLGMLLAARTQDELWFLKGRNDVYDTLLGLQAQLEQVREQLEAPEDNE